MFIFRHLLLAAMAMSLVMASHHDDGTIVLKQCADQEFDETYFSFTIDIDNFREDCEDFEELSEKIQLMIDKVQSVIPEYEGEEIDATVCDLPAFAGGTTRLRRLARRRRAGAYSYAGAGGCRRCKKNITARRLGRYLELGSESFEKRVCETLVGSAAVNAAVAEQAVQKSEKTLNDLETKAEDKETMELLDKREMNRFISKAKEEFEKCKEVAALAKAKGMFFENACKSKDFAGVVTKEDRQGFEMVANVMAEEIEDEAEDALSDFYHVKDEGIDFQTAVEKSKFREIEEKFEKKWDKKKEKFDEEMEELEEVMDELDEDIEKAKRKGDEKKEQKLKMEKDMLKEEAEELEDDFKSAMEAEQDVIDNNFEFALALIEVAAANTFEDYMEAFAELMTKGLEGYLNAEANGKFSACFEQEPKVEVETSQLAEGADEDDKDAFLEDCPKEVE